MTLARVAALPGWLADAPLQQLILQTEALPSWPPLYDELIRELAAPTPALPVIGDIIARDLGLTAKIMQLAQSAVFSARSILSLTEAVAFLGVNTLQMIAASGQVFARLDSARQADLSLAALWEHSVLVGRVAQQIALAEGASQQIVDYAAIAGLLHDVGKLILAVNLPEQYATALALTTAEDVSPEEAERQIFHATHAEVGAYLLSLWGLAEPIVTAVAFHHGPQAKGHKNFNVITAVYAADCLVHQTADAVSLDVAYLANLGLARRLPEWQRLCQLTLQEKDTP
jgi:putative nucleotidyltransferase with HDIG domain